jgi:hypothetical protein
MTLLLPRFLKTFYRREPISSFILILGAVDGVIGGVGSRWSLFSLGVMLVFLALGIRWWQGQKSVKIAVNPSPRRYLPPSPERPPLPLLTSHRQRRL